MEDFGRGSVNATSKNFTFSACIDESADQQVLILPCLSLTVKPISSLPPSLPPSLAAASSLERFQSSFPDGTAHCISPIFLILAPAATWSIHWFISWFISWLLLHYSLEACCLSVLIVAA
jgi:hypothetical protein